MGRIFKRYLTTGDGVDDSIYACVACGTHLALKRHLLSTNFRGRTGPASLFDKIYNVVQGCIEDSTMTTGMHSIRVVYCVDCMESVGWLYEVAFEEDQKYKEGRFILEEALIRRIVPSDDIPGLYATMFEEADSDTIH